MSTWSQASWTWLYFFLHLCHSLILFSPFLTWTMAITFILFFFPFIFISWRLITSQHFSGLFCHTLTWISHGVTWFPILIPPPTSLSTQSLWVFPVHQARALVSCFPPGLVICFTLDNIHVSMLFSQIIPPSPSPTESKNLFYIFLFLKLILIWIDKAIYKIQK